MRRRGLQQQCLPRHRCRVAVVAELQSSRRCTYRVAVSRSCRRGGELLLDVFRVELQSRNKSQTMSGESLGVASWIYCRGERDAQTWSAAAVTAATHVQQSPRSCSRHGVARTESQCRGVADAVGSCYWTYSESSCNPGTSRRRCLANRWASRHGHIAVANVMRRRGLQQQCLPRHRCRVQRQIGTSVDRVRQFAEPQTCVVGVPSRCQSPQCKAGRPSSVR